MEVAPLTPDRWRDFLDLFERKGPLREPGLLAYEDGIAAQPRVAASTMSGVGVPSVRVAIGSTGSSKRATTALAEKKPTIRARVEPTFRKLCGTSDGISTSSSGP